MRLLFIDGNNLMMRSFYANERFVDSISRPIGAIFGGFRSLFKIAREIRPDRVFWFWDGGHSKYRKEIYPQYKQRVKPDPNDGWDLEDFLEQVALMREYLKTLGVIQFKLPDQEADDLIYSMAKIMRGEEIVIASADRDFYQLLSDEHKVKIYSLKDNTVIDANKFIQKYRLMPSQWQLVRAIEGDASDNIKGVPGYGPVRALEIVQGAGNFSRLAETVEKRTPKLAAAMLENLAVVERNIKLIDLSKFPQGLIDYDKLAIQLEDGLRLKFNKEAFWKICEEHHFNSLLAENFDWEHVYAS